MPCACRSTVLCLRFSCCMLTGGNQVLPVAFTSSPLTLHTAYSSGLQQCSKPMSEGVTKRNAGLLWEAFRYEQFSPDTSDAERGNAAKDALRPLRFTQSPPTQSVSNGGAHAERGYHQKHPLPRPLGVGILRCSTSCIHAVVSHEWERGAKASRLSPAGPTRRDGASLGLCQPYTPPHRETR